ncbi:IclR family transcriptional regulator C-terminal domain-containing protein [Corynebacterium frankenforstense]|uniref:IclR family transcriptional regulator domain-containing protein n=1 Tax=Corynebacterium frankenforstense TaxID=1230998 RepID=UPI00254C6A4D|nr:IclR family transcriptional regulator C-terminal domain-containing protein [Corynebacterium frankenforstense]MDK6259364.1 IclR family transcriptional regulator C-terminal domain-containing protein [Corynebacterium frankenforstense]
MTSTSGESAPQPVQSLVRGLAVIRTFDATRPRQTLSQVAEATGLARATARRFLHTLVGLGYAATDGTEFWLTPKILELGYSYMSGLGLPAIAQPHLEACSRDLDESCSMAVLDGAEIVYVNRVPVRRIMTVSITVGTRFPAHATSMGRVLLGALDDDELSRLLAAEPPHRITGRTTVDTDRLIAEIGQARAQGWSLVNQELEAGLRSLAAPVTDADGRVVAAVNASTQTATRDLDELHNRFLPRLREAARAISADVAVAGRS